MKEDSLIEDGAAATISDPDDSEESLENQDEEDDGPPATHNEDIKMPSKTSMSINLDNQLNNQEQTELSKIHRLFARLDHLTEANLEEKPMIINEVLGEGGTSRVYLYRDHSEEAKPLGALKVFKSKFRDCAIYEAETMSKLKHPNII